MKNIYPPKAVRFPNGYKFIDGLTIFSYEGEERVRQTSEIEEN